MANNRSNGRDRIEFLRLSSGKRNKKDPGNRKRVTPAPSEQCAYSLWICRWPHHGNPRVPDAAAILRFCRANFKHETFPVTMERVPALWNRQADSDSVGSKLC
jgi:hypothetical protein